MALSWGRGVYVRGLRCCGKSLEIMTSAETSSVSAVVFRTDTLPEPELKLALESIRDLFTEYNNYLDGQLGHSISYQGFENELRSLPGKYSTQEGGALLLLLKGDTSEAKKLGAVHEPLETYNITLHSDPVPESSPAALGCICIRYQDEGYGEIKRLYIRPHCRGNKLGERLTECTYPIAKSLGYHALRLDSLLRLKPAVKMYDGMGFSRAAPYCENPAEDAVWFEKAI